MFDKRKKHNLPFYSEARRPQIKLKRKSALKIAIVVFFIIFVILYTNRISIQKHSPYFNIPSSHHELIDFEVPVKSPDKSAANDIIKELAIARNALQKPVGDSIPKIVHFVYGLRDPNPTLDLVHYIAIKAAYEVLKPDKIMFHYHYLPIGKNFERARPMLTLHKVPLVESVFDRPVSHYAHRADVVRLQMLEEFGGIYLDLDLISLKPLDHLLDKEFVMAQEGVDGSVGLCNAMIMARPHSRFLQRWFATYSTFDSSDWNYHSVVLPGKLTPFFPDEVTILNHTAFFWPLWDSQGLRTLYLEKSYNFSANLGTHIWESAANKNLMKDLSEDVIMNIDNSLYCQLRPFLLDGRPDPRPGSCNILSQTERSDNLIGHWALTAAPELVSYTPSTTATAVNINPLPAIDDSGNRLSGQIRNGQYANGSIYLPGDTSYIFLNLPTKTHITPLTVSWWMKTETKDGGKMAMVLQTDQGRICVTTQYDGALSLKVDVLHRNEAWQWAPITSLGLDPLSYIVDDKYHHYALVIGTNTITLYMDGNIGVRKSPWTYLETLGTTARGIWFGSIEPLNDHYQDPWDRTADLEAYYRDIFVFDEALNRYDVMQLDSKKYAV